MRLLHVEDEAELAGLTAANLGREGFAVDVVGSATEARAYLQAQRYDVVLLDLQLPDGDGIELLREIRAARTGSAVIALTARDLVRDRVAGLNHGADDYLVKPFEIDELVARIRAVLRRPGAALSTRLELGDLTLDTATRQVAIGADALIVPRRELDALELLLRSAGRVVTRDSLFDALYSFEKEPGSNVIDKTMSRLRRRLQAARSRVDIRVIRGVGYLLTDAGADA